MIDVPRVNFKCLGGMVLLKEIERRITKAGLALPDSATEAQERRAVVVSVGPGLYTTSGVLVPCVLSVGDTVSLATSQRAAYGVIRIDGEDYLLIRESELLGTIPDPEKWND